MTPTLQPAPFLAGGPLSRLYAGHGAGDHARAVRELFHYSPEDPAQSASRRAAAVDREYQGDRESMVSALLDANRRLGAGPAALATIERLRDPRSLAVVTGQQSGLFTGPFYTLLKAAGAVAVAQRLESLLGRPIVPVFWAATEDHDLAEADHAWLLDRQEAWRRIRYVPSRAQPGISVGALRLEASRVETVLAELAAALTPGPAARDAVELAASTGHASATLGEWSARLVGAICGPLGLPVLDPMQPEIRRLAVPTLKTLLAANREISAGLQRGAERVTSLGFAPQLAVSSGDANLFMYPDGQDGPRTALVLTEQDEFVLRRESGDAGRVGDAAALAALAEADPTRFSGNVVTRPVLQDGILPTVAYLAGPGEVAYCAMLGDCYKAIGRTMPLVWPRPSLTVVHPAVQRLLGKRGLALPDLPKAIDDARTSVIRAADDIEIDKLFASAAADVEDTYARIMPRLAGYDQVLGRLAEDNRSRVRREMEWLRRKAWQVARQRSAEQLGQLDRIATALWPRGGPQERTACGIQFIAEAGMESVLSLARVEPGPPYCHYYAFLG